MYTPLVTGTLEQWRPGTESLCGKNRTYLVVFMVLASVILSSFHKSLNILCKYRIFKKENEARLLSKLV